MKSKLVSVHILKFWDKYGFAKIKLSSFRAKTLINLIELVKKIIFVFTKVFCAYLSDLLVFFFHAIELELFDAFFAYSTKWKIKFVALLPQQKKNLVKKIDFIFVVMHESNSIFLSISRWSWNLKKLKMAIVKI